MKCGLVGYPNVGKSTIFNLIAQADLADVGDYHFCTIDPNIAEASIKDENIDQLALAHNSEQIIYPKIKIVDIAGLIKGASQGAGLGNQFLSHIKSVDLLIHVVGIFDTDNESRDIADAQNRINDINQELILSDIITCTNILNNNKIKSKYSKDQIQLLEKAMRYLSDDQLLYDCAFTDCEQSEMKKIGFVTSKPMVYAVNLNDACNIPEALLNMNAISVYPKSKDNNIDTLMHACYKKLGLITFYTAGIKEARGWKIRKGETAKEAAGAIHTDLSKKFIAAMVQSVESSIKHTKPTMQGKDYIVQHGDVCHFKCGK